MVSDALASAYDAVARMYASREVSSAGDMLTMTFLLDRATEGWARQLANQKSEVGNCETSDAIDASGALSGDFSAESATRPSILITPGRWRAWFRLPG